MQTQQCKHCLRNITWEVDLKTPGYEPRTGWADATNDPFWCGSAVDLTHAPKEVQDA